MGELGLLSTEREGRRRIALRVVSAKNRHQSYLATYSFVCPATEPVLYPDRRFLAPSCRAAVKNGPAAPPRASRSV